MMDNHSLDRHREVAERLVDTRQISDFVRNATHLGSFAIGLVEDGQYVPLADRYAVMADFSQIEILDGSLNLQYEDFKRELAEDPEWQGVYDALEVYPLDIREKFMAALFSTEVAKKFFRGSFDTSTKERRDLLGWQDLDPTRKDSYKIKKLSETVDDGVCAEYSLLVGEIMRRLGQDVQYAVGYRQDWPDEEGIYHAFLISNDSHILMDVYSLAETLKSNKPMGLLTAKENGIMQHPDGIMTYKDIFGRPSYYSATFMEPHDERHPGAL